MRYFELYTWRNVLGDHAIAHHDGAVSVMVRWHGIDAELLDSDQRVAAWQNMYRFIDSLDPRVTAEFHLMREYDASHARAYLERASEFVRAGDVCMPLRKEMAEHYARYSMSNATVVVLTMPAKKPLIGTARLSLTAQSRAAAELTELANKLMRSLDGAELLSAQVFVEIIDQTLNRDNYRAGRPVSVDADYLLNEQLVCEKPTIESGGLRLGNQYAKVVLLHLYPDAVPALSQAISAMGVPTHMVHILERLERDKVLRASERSQTHTLGLMGRSGGESKASKMRDEASFRATLVENDSNAFSNTFIVTFYGGLAEVTEAADVVADWASRGGRARLGEDVQLPFFRYGQPGQGHRRRWSRRDHTHQVANMLPVQVYRQGDSNPQMLRLGVGGQLVGASYDPDTVNHSFTAAMTGGGKGVNKVAQILETYPFGIDWYIMEVGTSYQWTVEALGGQYIRVDPDTTVPNPLPPYDIAEADDDGHLIMPTEIVTGTVEALMFLLMPGGIPADQEHHYTVVAQDALQYLYMARDPDSTARAPTLPLYLLALQDDLVAETTPQKKAAAEMANNLESFLGTREGEIFASEGNFNISKGITGVDLLLVRNKAKSLLKFYLVFISLAYTQHAFAKGSPSRVLLDEMHEYVKVAPDVIKPLCSAIARMGRKDGAALDLVTQETDEIDAIERAIINQCPWQTFLYRSADWDLIADRTNMPASVCNVWRGFDYPLNLPYRPGMQRVGDQYYNLHLTFPQDILDIASSSETDLVLKSSIPMLPLAERLEKLREVRQLRKAV